MPLGITMLFHYAECRGAKYCVLAFLEVPLSPKKKHESQRESLRET